MNDSLQKWHQLSREKRRILGSAIALLPLTRALTRCLGYRRTLKLISHLPPSLFRRMGDSPPDPREVRDLVSTAASRLPFHFSCLTQAMILHRLLASHGIESTIQFEATNEAGENFRAHAWVECGGERLDHDSVNRRPFVAASIQT